MTNIFFVFFICIALCAPFRAVASFRDLGVGAPVSESRGFVAVKDVKGRNLAIVLSEAEKNTQGYLLVVDIDSGNVEKVTYPKGVNNASAFASFVSRNGRFYTGAGPILLEFDPSTRQFLYHGILNPKATLFVDEAFADGPDGLIYIGTYPDCRLLSFDPHTKVFQDHGQIDPIEKYLSYIVFDSTGWAYAGIGTSRCNIVAFYPKTGEKRQMLEERERGNGTAYIFLGADGKVYGVANKQYYRMHEGKIEKIKGNMLAKKIPTGAINWTVKKTLLHDRRIVTVNPSEGYIETETQENNIKRIPIKFHSGGAQISSLAIGPDGYIYGSSAHPMHFFRHNASTEKLEDMGPVNRVGGGNFCAMAKQGQYLVAASYSFGILHIFDTALPFNGGYGEKPNPWEAAVWSKDIARPRACIAHRDGHTVLMSGFAGYGFTGGGLGLYDLKNKESILLTHNDLIPNESIVAMLVLPNGDIIGGTSIEAPGGGQVKSKHATLFVLDWAKKQVTFKINPFSGERAIINLEIGADGFVYGLYGSSRLFVFDPQKRKVIHDVDLSRFGQALRQSLVIAEGKLYAILSKSLIRIESKTFQITKLEDMPQEVTTGAVFSDGRFYFACGSHLWSYDLQDHH